MIGQGGFGKVYKGSFFDEEKKESKEYAVKVVKMHVLETKNPMEEIKKHKAYREL